MTVYELIQNLAKFNPNQQVVVQDWSMEYFSALDILRPEDIHFAAFDGYDTKSESACILSLKRNSVARGTPGPF
jgi:hypothetical protein